MLLPTRKDLDKVKADERKMLIDEGLTLAKRVDELRLMRLQMETNFEVWRKDKSEAIQTEINSLISKKDDLERDIAEKNKIREALLKPLDKEWSRVMEQKEKLDEDKKELFLDKERHKIETASLSKEREKLSESIKKAINNEEKTQRALENALNIEKQANQKAQKASDLLSETSKECEKRIIDLERKDEEYKVALKTIQIREKQVQEKEEELITRENDLTRRIKNLQRAEGIK